MIIAIWLFIIHFIYTQALILLGFLLKKLVRLFPNPHHHIHFLTKVEHSLSSPPQPKTLTPYHKAAMRGA
jgi:hypothetical protein